MLNLKLLVVLNLMMLSFEVTPELIAAYDRTLETLKTTIEVLNDNAKKLESRMKIHSIPPDLYLSAKEVSDVDDVTNK